jgi:septum formation topological specificity factor MinE
MSECIEAIIDLLAPLIGVVIGGLISFITTRNSLSRQYEKEKDAFFRVQKVCAYRTVIGLLGKQKDGLNALLIGGLSIDVLQLQFKNMGFGEVDEKNAFSIIENSYPDFILFADSTLTQELEQMQAKILSILKKYQQTYDRDSEGQSRMIEGMKPEIQQILQTITTVLEKMREDFRK